MFTKSIRLNWILSSLFFFVIAGCGDIGGGCGCASQPLPNGALPSDQTVEGGGQVRITQAGFTKLKALIPGFLNDTLESGFCIGQGNLSFVDYCDANEGPLTNPTIPDSCGAGNGCNVGINVDQPQFSIGVNEATETLNLHVQMDVHTRVHLDAGILGSCTMTADGNDLVLDVDLGFDIKPADGELAVAVDRINSVNLRGLDFAGCGILGPIIDAVGDIIGEVLDSFIGEFVLDLLTPTISDLVAGFLPDPLGIEAMMDVGDLMAGVSPGTEATMEARLVPGGYVDLRNSGMSLGLITGFNADEDITTRTVDLDSEPAYCVPPIPAPNFAAPPASLSATSRGTFSLLPAEEFLGVPSDPADDLVIGLSETTLDLTGHHLVTSGGMCLGVGTSLIAQLNLGTFSLLVPSLGSLGESTNPVLLVTRPQKAIDFTIGEGTEADPALTLGIHSFEVDVYVFAYERYTRAFTMKLDLDVGVNLEFDNTTTPATVTPSLVGLEADNITVVVLNSEFVRETPEELEGVLPTIFDLAVGLLGDGLGAIDVPEFSGFTLNNLRVRKVVTSEDDFVAIYATLGSSTMLREVGGGMFPSILPAIEEMDSHLPAPRPRAPVPAARLVSVDVPDPAEVRAALQGDPTMDLPSVVLDVPARDDSGRALEHAWRLGDTGMWRPYAKSSSITIVDRAFAWQGKYDIQVRSRVIDDSYTTSEISHVPVIIDSVGPEILAATYAGDALTVPARDIVSASSALVFAFGQPSDLEPATEWQDTNVVGKDVLDDLVVEGMLTVFAKDEAGNTTMARVAVPFHGQAGSGGCGCDSGGGAPTTGTLALMLMTAGLMFRRRMMQALAKVAPRDRRSLRRVVKTGALWSAIVIGSAFVPACNCGGDPGMMACEVVEDCTVPCPDGQIPFCLDGFCVCSDDVPYGRIGPYSDIAVAANGDAWVSAYAESHGDLVVAKWDADGRIPDEEWEFVDGVPDGPIAVPNSEIRGGITEEGPNVGMYTSIGVGPDDTVMVTYFDYDAGALKFARRSGDSWDIHVIDEGSGEIDPELGGKIAGLYSALTVRTDDGRPGVAYMALVSSGAGVLTTEVRFAAAQTANPGTASDWVFFPVDSYVVPPQIDGEPVDPHPIPQGLGLFVDATRGTDQAPAVVYYDRANGDLKLATFDAVAGTFRTPVVLDGAGDVDTGWYPSVALDGTNAAHVSYLSATRDDLMYVNTTDDVPEIVDDGYRIVGTTDDGLPKPEFHFVGDDSNLVIAPTGPVVVYQDATSHELLYSALNSQGVWQRRAIAGDEEEFVGAYGFFASTVLRTDELVISTWVIDQAHNENWVEIFREQIIVD